MTWDMTPGTSDTYLVRDIEAQFDPNTGEIGITSFGPWGPRKLVILNMAVPDWPTPVTARAHYLEGDPIPTTPPNPGSLYESPWRLSDGTEYIGEVTGNRVIQCPPIPVYRASGPQVLDLTINVQWYNPSEPPMSFTVKHYRGLDAAPWGANAERCGLWEQHTSGDSFAYNYVWKDGRLADQWYGAIVGNKIIGTQCYRVG